MLLLVAAAVTACCLGIVIAFTGDPVVAGALAAAIVLVAIILFDPGLGVLVYAALRPLIDIVVFLKVGGISVGQLWGAGLIAVLRTVCAPHTAAD